MSEIARPPLLITLVHGTWPRGLFPKLAPLKQLTRRLLRRKRLDPPPYWFEEGSPFLDRLSSELADIPHKFRSVAWSGANSISARDNTAHILAEHLSVEHTAHPEATQLIIAHSHGGNIALRALHHLQNSLHSADTADPLVVTLATPFIEIHQTDFGLWPTFIRAAVLFAIYFLLELLIVRLFPYEYFAHPSNTRAEMISFAKLICALFVGVPLGLLGWYWIKQRAIARKNQLEALSSATRLGEGLSPQQLFVIRAIDDEASLTMAFGTIVNYLTARFILITHGILMTITSLAIIVVPLWLIVAFLFKLTSFSNRYEDFVRLFCSGFVLMLFGLFALSRLVHGGELAKGPMEYQVNTQSTPDAVGLSKVISLIGQPETKSRRHGIYDHEDCPKAISDWVRSQLYGQPAR
jgi:hypothetical protein